MRRRVKGDYDDISNYIPKDKPTISRREKRKNQVMVASLALGGTTLAFGALLRYTVFADYFKPHDEPIPSAYARPTPPPEPETDRKGRSKFDGTVVSEERLRDRFLAGQQNVEDDKTGDSGATTSTGTSVAKETKASDGLIGPAEAMPVNTPIGNVSVAPPPIRSVNMVPEVKVSVSMPTVSTGLRPLDSDTSAVSQPGRPTGSANRAGSMGSSLKPSTPDYSTSRNYSPTNGAGSGTTTGAGSVNTPGAPTGSSAGYGIPSSGYAPSGLRGSAPGNIPSTGGTIRP